MVLPQADYEQATAAIAAKFQQQAIDLPILNAACRSRCFFHAQPTETVCLFLHGFTAAPYQFVPMAETFFQAGCNVLIPLMPGHGQAGDWGKGNPPPLPTEIQIYQDFTLDWFRQAQQLGDRVFVAGLSSGATLAAWLALEHPQDINRAVLFAAYLSSSNWAIDWVVQNLDFYFEWGQEKPSQQHFGYSGFAMPALEIFLDLGQAILERASTNPVPPLFLVSSEKDQAVSRADHRQLFERVLPHQPQSWYYCFDRELDIPHSMMTEEEGNPYANLLPILAKAFVESQITWVELQTLGSLVRNDQSFEWAVEKLKLGDRVSADLPAVITLMR